MNRNARTLLLTMLAGAPLTAQYAGEPAATLAAPVPFPQLGAAVLGGVGVLQPRLVPHASLPGRGCYCAASVFGVATARMTLRSGTFDPTTGTFTGNADVDAQNVAFPNLDLVSPSVTNDLKVLVFATSNLLTLTQTVYYATRSTTTGAFGAAAPVTGLPALVGDPQLGQIGGKPVLFYTDVAGLLVADLAVATGAITNVRVVCSTGSPHAPIPIQDAAGETRAIVFGDFGTTETLRFATTLVEDLGASPQVFRTETADFYFGGTALGGTLILGRAMGDPIALDIAGMVSAYGSALAPAPVDLACIAPPRPAAAAPYLAVTLLGLMLPSPLPLPLPFVGNLSLLNPIGLPAAKHDLVSGFATQRLTLPALPAGTIVYAQSAICDVPAGQVWLGNTAKVEWR